MTSIKALKELTNSGKKLSYRNKILKFIIERNGANLYEIESILGIKWRTASARVSELQDDGIIYVSDTFNDGKNSVFAFESDSRVQFSNRFIRNSIKEIEWRKKGIKNGWLK